MAIYHFSIKNIGRSNGRSAVASAAYRSGEKLVDSVYGKEQDYTKKTGIEYKNIYVPSHANENLLDRQTLWNEVEKSELKKNGDLKTTARLAKEFEIAFPHEVDADTRKRMLDELAQTLVKNHNVIVDAVIHAPHTKSGSDGRNYHAHIMFTTRSINEQGELGKKAREFNDDGKNLTLAYRELWANMVNRELEQIGTQERVSHLSYSDLKYDLEPTVHEGSMITQLRRQGIDTEISLKNDAIKTRNAEKIAHEQIIKGLDQEIITTNSVITHLKRSQLNEINQDHTEPHKNQENGLKRNSAQSTSIQNTYQEAKERLTLLNQQIEQLENNEPPAKKFGLFANKDHETWKETLKNLRDDREKTQNQVDQLIIEQMKKPENHLSKGFSQKTKEESKKLDFENVYRQLNQEQKQAYNALKSTISERFSDSQLELKLKQVQDKFIEKYQENPNFEMPKPEPQRPQQQDFVRGAIKDDQYKGR
ncbi:MobQ family relaxase [Comamonas jiangduensis]|uniref:MobQ family relaxase n=1 Tax=Comamonas jiangduensis TaxID=1194168 RepID=UPI003BF77D3F